MLCLNCLKTLVSRSSQSTSITPNNNVENSWVVRSNSYQMRVAPVADRPPGRYALVLKAVAYDFTVDGPLTDTAHCLERTDAVTSAVYTECPNL